MIKRRKPMMILAFALCMAFLSACSAYGNVSASAALPSASPMATPETAQPSASSAATVMPTPKPTPIPTTNIEPTPTPLPTPKMDVIGQVVCTAGEHVNIRAQAGTGFDIIGTFPAGQTADVLAYTVGWAHISYDGIIGFVSDDFIIARHEPDILVPTGEWAAILVSPKHYLPKDFEVTLADFENGQIDARIYDIAAAMFADAKADGVDFQLVDAYRSEARQSELFEEMVQRYQGKGYSREDAEVKAATITARPNTSEHQTGLVLDIVTPSYTKRNSGFANTDAFKWLNANAHRYGFTLRYKKGKENITGVIYESWHWRFVGTEAAAAMKQSGKCYEEYLGILN